MASGGFVSSSNFRNPFSKKRNVGVTETLDLISELPDSLLIQILSLLPTTKEAFTTSILCKRWRYLWTSLDTFNFPPESYEETQDFVSFVDYVLAHSVSSKIRKFHLNGCYLNSYKSHVKRWLSFVVAKNVEDFVYSSMSSGHGGTFSESFYTCSSLVTLDLSYCCFDSGGSVIQWKSLKSIKLEAVQLSDDDIVKLLSGCPALETMEFDRVGGFRRLEITSFKLKRLKLRDTECYLDLFEIRAPYLQHLEISGLHYKCTGLVDVSSVVNAKLTFYTNCIEDVQDLLEENADDDDEEDTCSDSHQVFGTIVQDYLQKLSCTTELTVGIWFIEVMCMLQFKGAQIPEMKCKYLTLEELHMNTLNLFGVAGLLRALPHVETLNIDFATVEFAGNRCHSELIYLAKGESVDLQSWISSFEFPNLKSVKIVMSLRAYVKDHSEWGLDKLFKLSEFLLTNAKVLEKFVIISKRTEWESGCVSKYLFQLAEKLLCCPRSSTNSVIMVFQE